MVTKLKSLHAISHNANEDNAWGNTLNYNSLLASYVSKTPCRQV